MKFRIIDDGRTGEPLATVMAAVATLKDAYFRGERVKVHGKVCERLWNPPIDVGEPARARYNELRAVDVIHP